MSQAEFINPPDIPEYNRTVWTIVQQVPSGQVTTFGQIASMIPCPAGIDDLLYRRISPRWVGNAMNAVSSKDDRRVPWWRVINSKGTISLPAGSKGATQQRQRLENEGVQFDSRDRVDLNQYGWDGPAESWLATQNLLQPKPLRESQSADDGPQQLSLF